MSQSRRRSLFETCATTAVGYCMSLVIQIIVFPLFNMHAAFHDNLAIGAIFTAASIVRGYYMRRFFNWWQHR